MRVTPAMQLGITDHIWTVGELIEAALDGVIQGPSNPQPDLTVAKSSPIKENFGRRFTVINGGRD